MEREGMGRLFLRQLVTAIPWGIIFLLVFFIAAAAMKQQIKEGIQFTVQEAVHEGFGAGLHLAVPLREEARRGIVFTAGAASAEIRRLLGDPAVKRNLAEILAGSGKYARPGGGTP